MSEFEKEHYQEIYSFLEQECRKITVDGFERKNTGWGERVFSVKKLENLKIVDYKTLIGKLKDLYFDTYNKLNPLINPT